MGISGLVKFDKKHKHHAGTSAEEKLFLYSLLRMLKPDTVLEIGVSAGHSTCWLAQALKDNKRGHLTSVDNWGATAGGCGPSPERADKRLRANKLRKFVTLVSADSHDFLKGCEAKSIDVIWVDGDHRYVRALVDIQQSLRIAKLLVIVHDTNQKAYDDVRLACDALPFDGAFVDSRRGMFLINPAGYRRSNA